MTSEDLLRRIRAKLGKVANDIDIEDIDIVTEATEVLTKIKDRIPEKKIVQLTTVANQREYDVSEYAVKRIIEVIYQEDIDVEDTELQIENPTSSNVSPYLFPSLWYIDLMRKKQAMSLLTWHFNPITQKVYIDPAPAESDRKLLVLCHVMPALTLETLPEELEDLLLTGTVWRCLSLVLLRRSQEGGILREGGMVSYPATTMKAYVDDYKNQFHDMLNVQAMIYSL